MMLGVDFVLDTDTLRFGTFPVRICNLLSMTTNSYFEIRSTGTVYRQPYRSFPLFITCAHENYLCTKTWPPTYEKKWERARAPGSCDTISLEGITFETTIPFQILDRNIMSLSLGN